MYNAREVGDDLATWTRTRLLDFCCWNDPNGDWDDADTETLREQIGEWCAENQETPSEIRRGSRRR